MGAKPTPEPLIRMEGRDDDRGYRDLARAYRKIRKELQTLSDAILLFADATDAAFMKDRTVPKEAGGRMAKLLTALDVQNDLVRYFTLGVDYRTDNKPAAVARLKEKGSGR